jgi:hypothetical protein
VPSSELFGRWRQLGRETWCSIGLGLLCLFAYALSPFGEFVYDDLHQVLRNPLIQQPELYGRALTTDVWAFRSNTLESSSNYYRPTFTAYNILCYQLFGLQPAGWKVANILLHAAVTVLLFGLLRRLGVRLGTAFATCLIFAVHPIHVESVVWIAGSPDLLMSFFLLLATFAYLKARRTGSWMNYLAACVAFFLALGSKELALGWLPAVMLSELFIARRGVGRSLVAILPFGLAAAGFAALRSVLLGQAGLVKTGGASNVEALLSIPEVLAFYLKIAFVPVALSPHYPLRKVTEPGAENFWIPLAVCLLAVGVAIRFSPRTRAAKLGWILFGCFLAPALWIKPFDPEQIVHDRYLYLPIAGLALVCMEGMRVFGLRRASRRSFELRAAPWVMAPLAISTGVYTSIWNSDVKLWERSVAVDQRGAWSRINLAEAYRRHKQYGQARQAALEGLRIFPDRKRFETVLGFIARDAGDTKEAERRFRTAMQSRAETHLSGTQLASLLEDQKRWAEVESTYRLLIQKIPANEATYRYRLGRAFWSQKKYREARSEFEWVTQRWDGPVLAEFVPAWFYLGEIAEKSGNGSAARSYYDEFLRRSRGLKGTTISKLRKQALEKQ